MRMRFCDAGSPIPGSGNQTTTAGKDGDLIATFAPGHRAETGDDGSIRILRGAKTDIHDLASLNAANRKHYGLGR